MNTSKSIDNLVISVKGKLQERGYDYETICRYQCCWNLLMAYMNEQKIESYSPKIGLVFLREVYGVTPMENLTKQQCFRARSVKLLNDFIETGSIYPASPKISAAKSLKVFEELFYLYTRYSWSCRYKDNRGVRKDR